MEENRISELDLESINSDFKFKNEEDIVQGKCNLTHSQCNLFKLLPYAANEKTLVSNFDGVLGGFSRVICDKELRDIFDSKEFIENVCDEIEEFEDDNSKQSFKNIINTMYINNDNKLVDFDIKTMNYIESTSAEEKYARFLVSIFVDEEIKEKTKDLYGKENNNILNRLVLRALPELKDKKVSIENYKCYLPYIKELFKKDFMFLLNDEELYKNSIKRFLDYYNMFYISQLCMKLSKFEEADLTKNEPLYYTLSWESTSKNRTAYRFGYDKLKAAVGPIELGPIQLGPITIGPTIVGPNLVGPTISDRYLSDRL